MSNPTVDPSPRGSPYLDNAVGRGLISEQEAISVYNEVVSYVNESLWRFDAAFQLGPNNLKIKFADASREEKPEEKLISKADIGYMIDARVITSLEQRRSAGLKGQKHQANHVQGNIPQGSKRKPDALDKELLIPDKRLKMLERMPTAANQSRPSKSAQSQRQRLAPKKHGQLCYGPSPLHFHQENRGSDLRQMHQSHDAEIVNMMGRPATPLLSNIKQPSTTVVLDPTIENVPDREAQVNQARHTNVGTPEDTGIQVEGRDEANVRQGGELEEEPHFVGRNTPKAVGTPGTHDPTRCQTAPLPTFKPQIPSEEVQNADSASIFADFMKEHGNSQLEDWDKRTRRSAE
ncbi:MAG: hypothetical protein Q9222_002406 [Ikaeria aurantiellina]